MMATSNGTDLEEVARALNELGVVLEEQVNVKQAVRRRECAKVVGVIFDASEWRTLRMPHERRFCHAML